MITELNNRLTTNNNAIICRDISPDTEISNSQFRNHVLQLRNKIIPIDVKSWLLYSENSYRFLVGIIALLTANKTVVVSANNRPHWLSKFQHQFDATLSDEKLYVKDKNQLHLDFTDDESVDTPQQCQFQLVGSETISLFTSGSTGEPKQINKTVACLTNEVATLEKTFSTKTVGSVVISSVSHLHIYGLLFKLFWPLMTGRSFVNIQINYPEQFLKLANQYDQFIIISSPALLSRLDLSLEKVSPKMVFSSGGPLTFQAAQESKQFFSIFPTEILGSTETGGIGYRRQIKPNTIWKLLNGVILSSTHNGTWLESTHVCTQSGILLDDHLELIDDQHFILKGRNDRVVNIEEKRISLTEIENYLETLDSIKICKSMIVTGKRDVIGCIVVLTKEGKKIQSDHGMNYLVKSWKTEMRKYFVPVTIPRKWRLLPEIPINAQSKVDTIAMLAMFGHSKL